MSKPFFITTAIDYTNGAPHIGHAYEKILADVLARYHRLRGEEVYFLTGVDQHGQKVQQSAEKHGIPPQEFVDGLTSKFSDLWAKLGIRYDGWAATTAPSHKHCVGQILTRLHQAGQLYKSKQGGYYSVRQEQFLTDKERNEQGEFGPEWGEVEFREEENYYFKLAEHRDWLLDLLDRRPDFVLPTFRRAELRHAVEKMTGDLCVSRPKSRLAWGIEFPFDPDFVTYVWFDALVNYLSFAPGFNPIAPEHSPHFNHLWPPLQVIGKDILIPAHGVYWPIMLKALGFAVDQMPSLLVHGWWNIAGSKMSKSLGNTVNPDTLADRYGAEALRHYLISDIATGKDADFSEERLVMRYNTDLANCLGNLLNRTLSMSAKYRHGAVTAPHGLRESVANYSPESSPVASSILDQIINRASRMKAICNTYETEMENFAVAQALAAAHSIATLGNELVDLAAPWKLAKDPSQSEILDATLYHLADSLRVIAILISPVMPSAAHRIFDQLQWNLQPTQKESRFQWHEINWGGLPDGHALGQPSPLFPRIETSPVDSQS